MRAIPGMMEVEGREFFYAEVSAGEGFNDFVNPALKCSVELPLPSGGDVTGPQKSWHIALSPGFNRVREWSRIRSSFQPLFYLEGRLCFHDVKFFKLQRLQRPFRF